MKTLDSIGIKLFLLATLKEHYLYLSLFFCMFTLCSDSVSALQVVLSNGLYECNAKWETWTDCWCVFSWSICNQNGHFIMCIKISNFQGYDSIYKSWEDIIN
jgi:hypothetical protein